MTHGIMKLLEALHIPSRQQDIYLKKEHLDKLGDSRITIKTQISYPFLTSLGGCHSEISQLALKVVISWVLDLLAAVPSSTLV